MQTLVRFFVLLMGTALSTIGAYLLIMAIDPFQCYQAGACNAGICFLGQLTILLPISAVIGYFVTHRFILKRYL